MSKPPSAVQRLKRFLVARGMSLVRSQVKGVDIADVAVYSDGYLAVRVEFNRSEWMIWVADAVDHPSTWYDPAVLREALGEAGSDSPSLEEEVTILQANWSAIRGLFSPERRQETHDRLDTLRKQRVHRLFPGW
jgi:hypothetical protein